MNADRALANALPQIIWTCDADGRLEWVNDRWFEVTGLSEQQTLGDKGALVAVHADDHIELARCWARALETSQPVEIEYRIRTVRGEYRWHLARVAPVRGIDGEVTRWVAATLDIHDRRSAEDALRASERQFETFFNLSPQPMAITRQSDGAYVNVNAAFTALTGYTRDEAVGRTPVELGMVTAEARAAAAERFRGGPGRSLEISVRAKDGRMLSLILSNAHIEVDGVPCFVNASTDLTQQRAIEEALRIADRRKDEFLALLSHELRNPLMPILTSTRLLESRVDAEGRHDLGVIVRQVKHLVRLVDDLLDVSRVARGAVTLSKARTEPAPIVARAVAATTSLFEERGHRLEVAVPPDGLAVEGDEVRLTQIVDNLLSNAARYTPPGGTIRVTGAREAESVVLRVQDTGIGIEPRLLPDLFEIFVQGPRGSDRADGGLGIGLSLVKALTELHGGTVTAESGGLGSGSTFTVRLPAAPADGPRSAPANGNSPAQPAPSPRTRVLIVDDHRDVVDGLSRLLKVIGYEVRATLDPSEAIALAESFRPHLAILDIGLPLMDGYALAEALRSHLGDATPVLIALTGYSQPSDRIRGAAAGFAQHLTKPVDVDELEDVLWRFAPASDR